MSLLVHYRQQMFFVSLIKEYYPNIAFNVVSHAEADTAVDITSLLPACIGYHASMEVCATGLRKYVIAPLINLKVTESALCIDGKRYRYCVMNDDNFCPILLAKLLTMKNVVVLDTTDADRLSFYEKCTLQSDMIDELNTWNSDKLRAKGLELYSWWTTSTSFVMPPMPTMPTMPMIADQVPEDRYSVPQKAVVSKDKKGSQCLQLSPTNGPDSLPFIEIYTDLTDLTSVP